MKSTLVCLLIVIITIGGCKKNETPPTPPTITSFEPQQLSPNNYVIIHGSHFDSVAANNVVTFNELPATIFKLEGDSAIIANVPENVTAGKITITANGVTVTTANAYTVLAGGWIRKADLPAPNNGLINDIGFAIGNTGYMGLGTDNGAACNTLYAYDPSADRWTAKSPIPVGLESPFYMVVNGKAYVGTGDTRHNGYSKLLFEYNPLTDTWTAKANFTDRRRGLSAFAVGDKGYAGFGTDTSFHSMTDWWQYNPVTDTWTRKADFPKAYGPYEGSGFAVNDKIYIALSEELWQYDPALDSWTKKNRPPLDRLVMKGVVIDNKGYLMGLANWLFDDATDTWTQKAMFKPRLGGAGFSIGNKGYYGTGRGWPSDFLNLDFWEYTPE